MTLRTLILRNLRFHARSHLGVLLGAAVGSAVLIGALVVGDSVRESLRERAMARLGWTEVALQPPGRFFSRFLAEHYQTTNEINQLKSVRASALLQLRGTLALPDGTARANDINIIGVGGGFSPTNGVLHRIPQDSVVLNEVAALQLKVRVGDEILVRIHKPTSLSSEASIAPRNDAAVALRLRVHAIVGAKEMGDFSLFGGQTQPRNAFVRLDELGKRTGLEDKANILLLGEVREWKGFEDLEKLWKAPKVMAWVRGQFFRLRAFLNAGQDYWRKTALDKVLVHANEELREIPSISYWGFQFRDDSPQGVELRSEKIFLEPAVVKAVNDPGLDSWTKTYPLHELADVANEMVRMRFEMATNHIDILTYLVNLLRFGTNTTPYSMVTAAGAPWTPRDMRDDEIVVNQWLAEDLQVKPGDEIALIYFDPESGARLVERTNTFRIRSVVPMEMPWADRTLMPDFPGIEKAESTHDWDAGFPLVHKIRQKDEDYWKNYRGTPKAFVTLAAGQKMWGNRFGNLTAIRFPIPANSGGTRSTASQISPNNEDTVERVPPSVENYRTALEKKILATLKPEELGLRFEPVREQALKAAEQSQDFGQLFLGFSFFLIVAALLLMALLFQFGLEQRTIEVGTLLALGFPPRQVRRLLLLEGCALALIGGVIGTLAGTVYAKAMLRGLTTIWRDAVGTSALHYYAKPTTLLIGLLASTLVAALTIWLTLRKQGKRPARELLADGAEEKFQVGRSRAGLVGAVATAFAAALVVWAIWKGETSAAEIFFSAGALLLVGGLGFCGSWFARLARRTASTSRLTIGSLGLRGCSRRRKRSLTTVAMLACGTFLIAAIGVFRLDANLDATKRSSGTGGFALIGESTLAVVQDLNSKSGRDFFGLDEKALAGVTFVPFRVRDGDDASCLNLNRAQKPRLLGVKRELLAERFTFAKGDGWALLKSEIRNPKSEIEVPAIGDANSIQWAMGKKVGDTIDYVDERGQAFKLRIVGAVANSILQGSLIIDEVEFIKRFPSESGYRMFLIDSLTNRTTEVSATLSRALQDVGLELQPTAQKLAAFNAVQNTYLSTFQILGGLGLLLGSAGLGVVVLRNVLERRGELALLLAVGFRARSLRWLVLSEHGALLWLGLGVGVIAAIVAVLPSLLSPGAEIPYLSLALTLAAVLINGMIWTWLATRFALRGRLLDALRNE